MYLDEMIDAVLDLPFEDLDLPFEDLDLPFEDLDLPFEDLDLPFEDLDIPFEEMTFEALPDFDTLMRTTPTVLSPPPTINQTTFTERICIRINRGVLAELKKRAAAEGVRYQTFINLLLAQCAGTSPKRRVPLEQDRLPDARR